MRRLSPRRCVPPMSPARMTGASQRPAPPHKATMQACRAAALGAVHARRLARWRLVLERCVLAAPAFPLPQWFREAPTQGPGSPWCDGDTREAGIYVFNHPRVMHFVMAIWSPFMSQKMKARTPSHTRMPAQLMQMLMPLLAASPCRCQTWTPRSMSAWRSPSAQRLLINRRAFVRRPRRLRAALQSRVHLLGGDRSPLDDIIGVPRYCPVALTAHALGRAAPLAATPAPAASRPRRPAVALRCDGHGRVGSVFWTDSGRGRLPRCCAAGDRHVADNHGCFTAATATAKSKSITAIETHGAEPSLGVCSPKPGSARSCGPHACRCGAAAGGAGGVAAGAAGRLARRANPVGEGGPLIRGGGGRCRHAACLARRAHAGCMVYAPSAHCWKELCRDSAAPSWLMSNLEFCYANE